MLEKMSAFFDSRLDGYEEHQLTCIEGARSFYPSEAGFSTVKILDRWEATYTLKAGK